MRFSVIIPTVETRIEALHTCLNQLQPTLQNLSASLDYEVIVSSDSLRSETESPADWEEQFPFVRRVQGPRRGPAANRNNGALNASGEWLIFVDDDCIPEDDWLSAFHAQTEQNPTADVFEGRTIPDRPPLRLDEVAPINDQGGFLWSCNFMVRRVTFQRLGGFDERFPFAAMEDVDFRERLKKNDVAIVWTPSATVVHPWRRAQWGKAALRRQIISHRLFYEQHPQQLSFHTVRNSFRQIVVSFLKSPILVWKCQGRGIFGFTMSRIYSLRMSLSILFLWWRLRKRSATARASN